MELAPWQWGLLIKPFVALVLLLFARWLGLVLLNRLPDGKLKRLLSLRW
jgi:hypothetical protein